MLFLAQYILTQNITLSNLASTFASETIDPSQYFNSTTPVTITGATTGVTAVVIGFDAATSTDQPTLYLRYVNTGTDNVTNVFADGENISADAGITTPQHIHLVLHLLQHSLHFLVQLQDQVQQILQVLVVLLLEEVVHFILKLVFTIFVVSLLLV